MRVRRLTLFRVSCVLLSVRGVESAASPSAIQRDVERSTIIKISDIREQYFAKLTKMRS